MQINQKPSMCAQVILRSHLIENNGLPLLLGSGVYEYSSYFFQGAEYAIGKGLIPSQASQACLQPTPLEAKTKYYLPSIASFFYPSLKTSVLASPPNIRLVLNASLDRVWRLIAPGK